MKRCLRGKKLTMLLVFLLGISLPCWVVPAERKIDLTVVYRPPRLSVEARGVSLSRVLREIGAKVGFVIEEKSVVDTVINLSIQEGTIEEVLARLLTGQSYALVSQDDRAAAGPRISKIFLLGPGNNVVAAALPRSTQRENSPATFSGPSPLEIARIYPAPTNLPSSRVTETRSSQREPQLAERQPTVDDLLMSHAISGLGGPTFDPQNLAMNVPQPFQPGSQTAVASAADISDSLAKTTLLAQQNLQALVQGLATATESLMQSSAPVIRR